MRAKVLNYQFVDEGWGTDYAPSPPLLLIGTKSNYSAVVFEYYTAYVKPPKFGLP